MKTTLYSRVTIAADGETTAVSPSGRKLVLTPFLSQPIAFSYDAEGLEQIGAAGTARSVVRLYPDETGVWTVSRDGTTETLTVEKGSSHGYVEVSKNDPRYFAFTDGAPFTPIGVNLAFLSPVGRSNGREFGLSGGWQYLGMRQYERWFRQCHDNGVNLVRIWLGHEYFCPDTEEAGVLDQVQLAKIDALLLLAARYGIRLKLTVEQFRFFDYVRTADSNSYSDDIFRKFNKRLYKNGRRCGSSAEWMKEDVWREAWLDKMRALAARLSGDPTVFGVELWNEMNCMPSAYLNEWNERMLPAVRALFPHHLVMNSLGSFDSENSDRVYHSFCWERSDLMQMHRYLDQGAPDKTCNSSPIELIRDGISRLKGDDKPFFVAETGAVNDRHSGPFRYYAADHRGILFCDLVYTPLFCGAAGCGHIWHWDERYLEAKNLYPYYAPLAKLCEGVAFDREGFRSEVYEDGEAILLTLVGKTVTLGYLRNKADSWQTTLRDLRPVPEASPKRYPIPGTPEIIPIWQDESARLTPSGGGLLAEHLTHGLFLKWNR